MMKEFIKIAHKLKSSKKNTMQQMLLYDLEQAVLAGEIKTDRPLTLIFNDYEFDAYPSAKLFIKQEYTNKYGELYWCGEKYDSLDKLYDELKDQKYLATLTVIAE